MTIIELTEILKQYPPHTRIAVAGYEGGYNDISSVATMKLKLNARSEWYYGAHEEASEGEETVVVTGRNHNDRSRNLQLRR